MAMAPELHALLLMVFMGFLQGQGAVKPVSPGPGGMRPWPERSSCGLSATPLAVRLIWRAARAISSAARFRRGSVVLPNCSAAWVRARVPWLIWSMAPSSAFRRWLVLPMSLARADTLALACCSDCKVLRASSANGGSAARAASRRWATLVSSRRVSVSIWLATWLIWPRASVSNCWLPSPSSWLMRRVASSACARMVGACSASLPNGEGLSGKRGKPPGPGGSAGEGVGGGGEGGVRCGGIVEQHMGQARHALIAEHGIGGGADGRLFVDGNADQHIAVD